MKKTSNSRSIVAGRSESSVAEEERTKTKTEKKAVIVADPPRIPVVRGGGRRGR